MQLPEEWVRECVRAVDELKLTSRDKTNFLANMLTLGGLVYDPQTLFKIISEETMYESSIVRHFAERGRREGIEQGRQEGRMLSVLDLVSARFGSSRAEQLKPTFEFAQDTALFQPILIKVQEPRRLMNSSKS